MLFPIFCFILVVVAAVLVITLPLKKIKGFLKRCGCAAAVFLLLSVCAEASIFNMNFYRSAGLSPVSLDENITNEKTESGAFILDENGKLWISDIGLELQNICLEFSEGAPAVAELKVYFIDDALSGYALSTQRTIYTPLEKSRCLNLNLSGVCHGIMLDFSNSSSSVRISSVTGNSNRAFDFNFFRVLVLLALLTLLYIFKPGSQIYKIKYTDDLVLSHTLTADVLCVAVTVIIALSLVNPAFVGIAMTNYSESNTNCGLEFIDLSWEHHGQYAELAEALCEGRLYLADEVPQSLIDMENPYDPVLRSATTRETGDEYRWDVAYYNGHYYVYFGIVPVLMLYLPFYLITDSPFPSALGVAFYASLAAIGIFLLLTQIIKRYFDKTSLGAYLLTGFGFVTSCGIMFLAKRPDFYSVPIAAGIAFTVWGLALWLMSFNTKSGKRQLLYCLFGSLCMALTAGCRPQLVLISAVAVPLFWSKLFKDKYILSKRGIWNTVLLAAPYIIVAAGLMYYNYARFGSPIDFGSSYNLTTNDVTARGIVAGRTGLTLFTYLLQPPTFTALFPFLEKATISTNYIGTTVTEACFGGLITCTPLLWSIFALRPAAEHLKKHKALLLCSLFIALGVIITIVDGQGGGLLQRYYSDFGFVFFIGASFIIFCADDKYNSKPREGFQRLLLCGTVLSVLYTALLVFSRSDVTINTTAPALFYTVLHTVQFWL